VGQVVSNKLSFGDLTLLKAGTASYQNPDPTDPAGSSRWGDYSATSLDPADPTRFWTIQMIPVSGTSWQTQITEIITTVSVSIISSGTNLIISWPAGATGLQLQQATSLSAQDWTLVPVKPTTVKDVVRVVVPISTAAGFFRLASANTLNERP